MKTKIEGQLMETLSVELDNEKIFAEAGSMLWMSDNVKMDTKMRGGLGAGIGRMFSGESMFLTEFSCDGKGLVVFGNETPGKIIELNLKENESMICEKDAFLCAEDKVKLKAEFTKKFGAGLLGGEGFVLQKVTGPGKGYVRFSGEIIKMKLEAGQILKVDTGALAMMDTTITYDIKRIKGMKNMFLGGEGLFLATVEGPGTVWLQSMPISSLAHKLIKFIPRK